MFGLLYIVKLELLEFGDGFCEVEGFLFNWISIELLLFCIVFFVESFIIFEEDEVDECCFVGFLLFFDRNWIMLFVK